MYTQMYLGCYLFRVLITLEWDRWGPYAWVSFNCSTQISPTQGRVQAADSFISHPLDNSLYPMYVHYQKRGGEGATPFPCVSTI